MRYLNKIFISILLLFVVSNESFSRNIKPEEPSLTLSPSSLDDNLLEKDPFDDADFIKSVQVRGNTRINSTVRTVKTVDGKTSNFGMNQNAGVNLSGRLSRTLNFRFNLNFRSGFLGFQENFGDVEDQTIEGVVNTGAGGGSVALEERTSIGSFKFGLYAGINYYGGTLTYGGTAENLLNSNFRNPPRLIRTAQGFSSYERLFNQSGLSAQPEVIVRGIISPNRAKGIQLNYLSNGGKGINSISFVGISPSNTHLNRNFRRARVQTFSTTFFNKTYRLFNVNVFRQRAKYEVGLTNQWITGVSSLVNGAPINFYVHTFNLGRRTGPTGRPLSLEYFQPEYEISFVRYVTPKAIQNGGETVSYQDVTSVGKGIVLRHAINGGLFGVDNLALRLNMFHVDSGFINPNGGFLNTSRFQAFDANNLNVTNNDRFFGLSRLFYDRILPIDGIANNRQGINFQYGYQFYEVFAKNDALRITGGNEVSKQLKESAFNRLVIPFGGTIIRTDLDETGRPTRKLFFSTFEVDAKYLGKFVKRDIYLQTYYLSYTTKSSFHLVPDLSNQSYVRASQANIGVYYHLIEGFVPTMSFTYSRVRGNINTVLSTNLGANDAVPTFIPRDIVTKSLLFGINTHLNRDYSMSVSYTYTQQKDLSLGNSKRIISLISFGLIYNFRAT